jgi:hypothetical protein
MRSPRPALGQVTRQMAVELGRLRHSREPDGDGLDERRAGAGFYRWHGGGRAHKREEVEGRDHFAHRAEAHSAGSELRESRCCSCCPISQAK